MPNTLYRYTDALGMIEETVDNIKKKDLWHASEDEAMIFYLNEKKESILDGIDKLTQSLKENNKELKRVNKQLEPYKEKYPEIFI